MPIRINLLAEAQAAEQMKRRDPVKFAIYAGVGSVVLMLVWWSGIKLQSLTANGNLARVQEQIQSKTSAYKTAITNQTKIADAQKNLIALQTLAAVRLLQGNLLDTLQHSTVDGVQLSRLRIDQVFNRTEATKPTQNGEGRTVPGKPATVDSKASLYLDAKDVSATPGDQVNKFKQMLAAQEYFKSMLNKTNGVQLISVSPPQAGPDGRPYVAFQIECDYQEVLR